MDKKFVDLDNLARLANALDERFQDSISEEANRASAKESQLEDLIDETVSMLGGKTIKYVTQAEYDSLTDAEKNDPEVVYFVTDAYDDSHTHENKELLDNFAARNITIGNKTNLFDGSDNISYTLADIGAAEANHTHDDKYYTESEIEEKIVALQAEIDSDVKAEADRAKEVEQGLQAAINNISSNHTHDDRYYTESEINTKITSLQAEIDSDVKVETDRAKEAEQGLQAAIDSKADAEHGTHVTYATVAPKANGTAAVGTSEKVAREDHIHPAQTNISGNAGTANKLAAPVNIAVGNKTNEFDGSENISFTLTDIGAAPASHGTHLSLGTGSGNAYYGDKGKIAYDHSQASHAPSNAQPNSEITKAEIENKLTGDVSTHNHTSLTGITNLAFASEDSDSASISTTISGVNTYFDFNLADDSVHFDAWRWRFTPSGKDVFNAMTLDMISATESALTVAGNITATSFTENGTALSSKYAAASHGTHVDYATATPKANGTAAIGASTKVAREDHVHPLQTSVSGNAGTATKLETAKTLTIGNSGKSFDGSENISWSLDEIGAMPHIIVNENVDLDSLTTTGIYSLRGSENTNAPASGNAIAYVGRSLGTPFQMYMHDIEFKLFYRYYDKTNSVWMPWSSVLDNDITGNAATADLAAKLTTARNITIGNKTNSFDGSENISFSLADIGAEPAATIVDKTPVSGTLTLSTNRYQRATTLADENTIALPTVSTFTEINLYYTGGTLTSINVPNCKWRVDPNFETGTAYKFTFTYIPGSNIWLAEATIYS